MVTFLFPNPTNLLNVVFVKVIFEGHVTLTEAFQASAYESYNAAV